MRHSRLLIKIAAVGFFLAVVFTVRPLFGAECTSADECKKKIEEYEQKLKETRAQKDTLSSQIETMDTQIRLTQLRISHTEREIEETQAEIESLSASIEDFNESLDYLSQILLQKIVDGYKRREVSFLEILLDTQNISNLTNRIKYIKQAQDSDRRVAFQIEQTKINYEEQKDLREEKKATLDALKKRLDAQRGDLNRQKVGQQALLEQTKQDEKRYQELLAQALAEFQAIERAVATGTKIGDVKRGDPIALIGNTGYPGCSTGKHLHFEVRRDGQWVDPGGLLASRTLGDDQNGGQSTVGGGGWDWPIEEPVITQYFGNTPWSWKYTYSGGIHTGYDMISRASDVIRAPEGGTLYSSAQQCGSGSLIKIRYIDHGGGLMSFYLHVQ